MYHLNESVLCLCWRAPQCESLSADQSRIQILVTGYIQCWTLLGKLHWFLMWPSGGNSNSKCSKVLGEFFSRQLPLSDSSRGYFLKEMFRYCRSGGQKEAVVGLNCLKDRSIGGQGGGGKNSVWGWRECCSVKDWGPCVRVVSKWRVVT